MPGAPGTCLAAAAPGPVPPASRRERRTRAGLQRALKEIMAENFPASARDPHIEDVNPIEDNPKAIMPRHVGIKLVKTTEKKKNRESSQRKTTPHPQGKPKKNSNCRGFLIRNHGCRSTLHNVQVAQPKSLFPGKIPSVHEGVIKAFPDEGMQGNFVAKNPVIKKWLKDVPYTEKKGFTEGL